MRAVLPQFSPSRSPSHVHVHGAAVGLGGVDNPAASDSDIYIPTEDEIEHMESIGETGSRRTCRPECGRDF